MIGSCLEPMGHEAGPPPPLKWLGGDLPYPGFCCGWGEPGRPGSVLGGLEPRREGRSPGAAVGSEGRGRLRCCCPLLANTGRATNLRLGVAAWALPSSGRGGGPT